MHRNELHSSVSQMETCYWNVKYGYTIWNVHCVRCSKRFKCTIHRCKLQKFWWNIYGGVSVCVCGCNLIKVLQQGSCRCKHVTTRQDHRNIHCCLATKTTTLLITPTKCTQQIAFGVLSIQFNRIINLHSFLIGYDECWSMWYIHRWCVYVLCVCVCVYFVRPHSILPLFLVSIETNKQRNRRKTSTK